MFLLFALFVASVELFFPTFSSSLTIPATSHFIRWQGRKAVVSSEEGTVSFDWEGVRADFRLSADATYVTFSLYTAWTEGPALFHVYKNRTLIEVLSVNATRPTDYRVSLSGGDNRITLWSVTDPCYNGFPTPKPFSLNYAVSFTSDGTFDEEPERIRTLEIIGDSITAGNQMYPPCTNASCDDQSGTYGAQLCESFQANCTTLAISGKGLYVNCCDNDTTMVMLVDRTHVTDVTSQYDWSLFRPDAVLLNLGTNDWGHGHDTGPAWEEAFTEAYVEFLVKLTRVHDNPHLPIFCGVGPITNKYGACVTKAMQEAATKYGVLTYLIDYTGAPLDGCGHPGVLGHKAMFEKARPIIASTLKWDYQ